MTTTGINTTEFGTTPAYRIGERVEARGVGDQIITGIVVETRGGMFRDDLVNVDWDHLGYTNWETPAILRPAGRGFRQHRVTVYLNESRDASFGFDNEYSAPALRKAVEFDVRAWHRDGASTLLAVIYQQLNIGGSRELEAQAWTEVYRMRGNRSLSVGDVVVLDGQAYAVARAGFEEIADDHVKAAIADYVATQR